MSFEELVQQVRPGATQYLVLVSFGILCFKVGKYFWDNERNIIESQLERVKALKDDFRTMYVEPLVVELLKSSIDVFRSRTLETIKVFLEGKIEASPEKQLDKEILRSIPKELAGDLHYSVEKFAESKDGAALFEKLDQLYDKERQIYRGYEDMKYYNTRACFMCFVMGVFFWLGLTELLVNFSPFWVVSWANFLIIFFVSAAYYILRYKYAEKCLNKTYEKLLLYGGQE